MKRILVIAVLAVLLLSTVGATAATAEGSTKTALTCEPPAAEPAAKGDFDIHGTLTSGKSNTAVPGKLITVYVSGDHQKWMDEKWMEVGSVKTDKDGKYTVTTRQVTPGTYSYKAVFAGDEVLKEVTSPKTSVTVNPSVGGGSFPPVCIFELHNDGVFIAKLACYYSTDGGVTWHESIHTDGISKNGYIEATLYEDGLNVPNYALVRIHAIVVGGSDRTGSEIYQYIEGLPPAGHYCAEYSISGTTLTSKLSFIDYYNCGQ